MEKLILMRHAKFWESKRRIYDLTNVFEGFFKYLYYIFLLFYFLLLFLYFFKEW